MTPATPEQMEWARQFVNARRWTFARTMAKIPHEWTLRKHAPEADFCRFVMLIRECGYTQYFFKKAFVYLDIDGWQYWTMGAPLSDTTLINRAAKRKTP